MIWLSEEIMSCENAKHVRFVVIAVAGWMNQEQQHVIEYLREENRVPLRGFGTR